MPSVTDTTNTESPTPPRRIPSRALLRDAVIFAVASSTAFAVWYFRPALERRRLAAAYTDDYVIFAADGHKPTPTPSLTESAQVSKAAGLKACREEKWGECYQRLDEARADDPTLEKDPELVAGRELARSKLVVDYRTQHQDPPGM